MNTYSEIDASPKTRARTGVAALASLSLALFAGAKAYSHSSAASSVVTAFDVLVESNATRACAACADLSVMDCVIALGAQAKAKGQQALVTSDPSFSSDSTFVNELTSLCAEGTISLSTDEASTLISDFYTTEVADGASTLAQFDTDSSGGISMDEWIAAYSDLESAMPAQATMEAFMSANDQDGDAEISLAEAIAAGAWESEAATHGQGAAPTKTLTAFERDVARVGSVAAFDSECCDGGCWCLFLFCPSTTCWWYDCADNWCCISACSGNFYCENSGCGC